MTVSSAVKSYTMAGIVKTKNKPVFSQTKANNTKSASSTTTTSSLKNSAASSLQTMQAASLFSGNSRTNSPYPYVGSLRTVKPSDYKMDNVVHVESGNYLPTRRSMNRMISSWEDRMNAMYQYKYGNIANQNKGTDVISAMSMLTELAKTGASVAKEIMGSNETKSVQNTSSPASQEKSDYEIANQAANNKASVKTPQSETPSYQRNDVTVAVNNLSSADTSKVLQEGLKSLESQISTKKELSQSLVGQIKTDTDNLNTAEGELATIKSDISATNTQINGLEATISRLESQQALYQSEGLDFSGVTAQLEQAKAQLEQAKAKLTQLKEDETAKNNEIEGYEKSISENTQEKEKTDAQLAQLTDAHATYDKKLTKMEKSEFNELKNIDSKIKKLRTKISTEKNEDKKAKFSQEFQNLSAKFNGLIDSTIAPHNFQKITEEDA